MFLNWLFFLFFFFLDSDSDNFQTLKKVSKPKQNGSAKQAAKPGAGSARQGVKEGLRSPPKPSTAPGKAALKSPVTPKSTSPPTHKQTPTSVLDYFGSAAVQRSDKKLVASIKRKAVSASSQPSPEVDDLSDEQIAKQLQMDEDMMEVGGSLSVHLFRWITQTEYAMLSNDKFKWL